MLKCVSTYLPGGVSALHFQELVEKYEGCVLCPGCDPDLGSLLHLVAGDVVLGVEPDAVEREGDWPDDVKHPSQGALPLVQKKYRLQVDRSHAGQRLQEMPIRELCPSC